MVFSLNQFYTDLDAYYSEHNNAATEAFLLSSKAKAYEAGMQSPIYTGCPSCSSEPQPNYEYVSVCNETACFYRGLSRWQDSLDMFREAQKELNSYFCQETEEYATILLNKAGTYRYMGDLDSAIVNFKHAAEIIQNTGAHPSVLAGLYNNVGLVYLDKQEGKTALSYFTQALPLISDDPDQIVETGTTWNNIATAYNILGQVEDAVDACNCSCTILESLDNGVNPHFPHALNTRGVLAFRAGQFDDALNDLSKASSIIRLVYGENIEYSHSLANIAAVYQQLGNMDKAAELISLCDSIKNRLHHDIQ